MTATLGGYALTIEDSNLGEDDIADSVAVDAWKNGAFQHDLLTRRKSKVWTLRCVENNVAWADSSAKKLQDAMASGTLALVIDEGVLHQVKKDVYLTAVAVTYEGDVRVIDLTLSLKEGTLGVGSENLGEALNPINPPDVIGYKYAGVYYTKRLIDGVILGAEANGLIPLQNAVNDVSVGSILLSDDYDASGGGPGTPLTIAKSNVSIFSFMRKGGDSGGDWFQPPCVDRILIDASSYYRRNLHLAGLCTREIDLYANGNPIIELGLERVSLRPSSGYYGLRFRGASYIDYVHADDLTIMNLLDDSATGRGAISFENTVEGTGQIWLNSLNYKARSNGARLIGVQDGCRVDQLLKIDGMSYVVWGFTGTEFFRLGAGSKVLPLKVLNSTFEHHNPTTLFNFTGGGGDGLTCHNIDFSHNSIGCPETGGVTFMNNLIADAKYRQYGMSYLRGHGNTIGSIATGGTFALGTTGACAHNIVDLGYVYWRGTTEVNNVATKG